jgi:hypothetical protein
VKRTVSGKSALIILFIALCGFLCGCGYQNATAQEQKIEYIKMGSSHRAVTIWTDGDTGVQYIMFSDWTGDAVGGVTPRLNADGSLYIEED